MSLALRLDEESKSQQMLMAPEAEKIWKGLLHGAPQGDHSSAQTCVYAS